MASKRLSGGWKAKLVLYGCISVFALVIMFIFMDEKRSKDQYLMEKVSYYEKEYQHTYSSLYLLNEQISSVYRQLLLNRNVTNWLNHPTELIQDMYQLSQIQNTFGQLTGSYPGIDSFYLYNKTNGIVLSTQYMLSDLEDFPRKQVFDNIHENNPAHDWQINGNTIAWTANIPNRNSKGTISINISTDYIIKHVMDGNANMIWVDDRHEVLMARDDATLAFYDAHRDSLLDNPQYSHIYKDHLIIASESAEGSWRLLTIIPVSDLLEGRPGNQINNYAILAMVVVLVGLLLLYLYMMKREQDMRHGIRIKQGMEDVRRGLVAELLSGKPIPPDFLEKSKENEMNMEGEGYQVIVLQIDDYYNYLLTKSNHERFFMNKIVFNSIRWMFAVNFNAYILNSELEKITVLICYDTLPEGREGKLQDTIAYIQNDIKEYFSLTVCVGISEITRDLAHIHTCYGQAMQAVSYKAVYGKQAIIYYDQLSLAKSSHSLRYPEKIHQLLSYLREGIIDEVEHCLDEILEELISSEQFELEWIHAVFANLMAAIMKYTIEQRVDINELSGQEDIFLTLYSYEFVEDKKAYLLHICKHIIELQHTASSQSNSTISAIMDYIDKNFDKPISLSIVAGELSMSSSYLSVIIKNHLGIGFVEYINKLRIQKAVMLLDDSAKTVMQIAEECGYDTVHTFIRQFKKAHHVPPNEYRTRKRIENFEQKIYIEQT